jgi:hypothetical protein
MSFSQENGYVPNDIETLMDLIRVEINSTFGTSYSQETFVGSGWYKYFYVLVQKLQENEIKTAEIFVKLQEYFRITNERIARPVVTNPGLIEILERNGFISSVKKMIDEDAGKIHICVDVDDTDEDYAATKLEICNIIKDSTVAGAVTQGTESESITLSNGQSFDFKFNLPNRIETLLRLTITLSDNNQFVIGDPDETKLKLLNNILTRYRLGRNFEPQKYFSVSDAPWASQVKLEWSINDGVDYFTTVYVADYDDLFDVSLENITLVEE